MRALSTMVVFALALAMDAVVAQPVVTPGPSQPVKVTNDASAPVPVAVSGGVAVTGPVTVGNTAANPVPVSIQSIQGTPVPVSIQGTATVSGSVSLSNAFVPVTVVDDLVNEPRIGWKFDHKNVVSTDIATDGRINVIAKLDVPDGKRFVVETITITGEVSLEDPPLPVSISYAISGAWGDIPHQRIPIDPADSESGRQRERLSAVLPMKMRVDARTGVTDELMFILRTRFPTGLSFTGTKPVAIEASAFGYLVDLP